MGTQVLRGETARGDTTPAEQVVRFSRRYIDLLGALARSGSEVVSEAIYETDPDIAPCSFIRNAHHVFVFPPQEVELHDREDIHVGEIPGTRPYTLVRHAQIAEYDETLVEGRVVVAYDDANTPPVLRVTDLLEYGAESNLPEAVRLAIATALEPVDRSA